MKLKNIFIGIGFLIFGFYLLVLSPVSAEEKKPNQFLRISPILLNISLSPGKTYSYDVELENLLDIPLPLKAELDKLYTNEEGGQINLTKEESLLISWVKIDPTDFIIPAQSKKNTTVIISIPDKIPVGGYYGMIFFQPLFPQTLKNLTQIRSKIGLPILANIGITPSKSPRGEIYHFKLDKLIYENNPINYILSVKNNSLYHFSAKPFFIINPLFGHSQKTEIGEKIILPGKFRSWSNSILIDRLIPGIYPVSILISTGEGYQISKNVFFIKLPINKILFVMIAFSLLIFVIARKKQIIKAINSLIR